MNVSRSGYYKWIKNRDILNNYEINRKDLGELIKDIHKRKPSYGYHRINYLIRKETGWVVSETIFSKGLLVFQFPFITLLNLMDSSPGFLYL